MQYTNFESNMHRKMIRTMIWCFFFPLISYIQEQGIHIFFSTIPDKQLITSVFRLHYWTEVWVKWWTLSSGNMHRNQELVSTTADPREEGQTADMWSETLPSQLYLLLLIVDRCEATAPSLHVHIQKKKQGSFLEKRREGGGTVKEGLPGCTPAGPLQLWRRP